MISLMKGMMLTGDTEMPAVEALMGSSEASAEGAGELLTSLDSLSDDVPGPIYFEPATPLEGPEMMVGGETDEAEDSLTISLDDLSEEPPELVLFEPETEAAISEVKIDDEVVFEPETILSEDTGPEKEGFWESEAIESRTAEMQLDDDFGKEGFASDKGDDAPGKGDENDPYLFELELEPLELDMEIEGADKKTA